MDEQELEKICMGIKNLLIEKNKRYGENNIRKFGEQGIVIRASDKVERLRTMLFEKVGDTQDETVDDTWMDLAGYAILALMLRKGHL